MTTGEAIELIKSNELTPIEVRYDGDGFARDIGYVGCEEYDNVYLLNGEANGKGGYANLHNGVISIVYINKGVTEKLRLTIEYITDSKYALRLAFLHLLSIVNCKIQSQLLSNMAPNDYKIKCEESEKIINRRLGNVTSVIKPL